MSKVLVVDDTAVDRRLAGGFVEAVGGVEVAYAQNGQEAIESMERTMPDLVVTDLQMPEMDGLELVTRIRMQFPQVPVILMTAQGSETIAMAALEQGASSYVPKSQLKDRLTETVREVLSMTAADRTYSQLMRCQTRIEFSYVLENNPQLIDALVELVQQIMEGLEITDHTGKFRVGVALREALHNAMYRGNLEISVEQMQQAREGMMEGKPLQLVEQRMAEAPYRDRRIHVDGRLTRDEARFDVRDEGPGFDVSKLPARGAEASLQSPAGRGLVLIHSFLDEVKYNQVGNQVTLIKRRDQNR